MIFSAAVLGAALAISAADRLAMADRLFNRGDYTKAQEEYRALSPSAEVDYRLVSVASALGDRAETRAASRRFLAAYPADERTDRVRLLAALAGTDDERKTELKLLDRAEVSSTIRAEALYHLAMATEDKSYYERSFMLDPKCPYAPYAKFAWACQLLGEANAARRQKGEELLLELVQNSDNAVSGRAMYMLSAQLVRTGRCSSASILLKRHLAKHPNDPHEKEIRRLLAKSELSAGRYDSAMSVCVDEADEDMLATKVQAAFFLGKKEIAQHLAEKYLAAFPAGANHTMVELVLARRELEEKLAANDTKAVLEAARRCANLAKTGAERLRLAWAYEKANEVDNAESEYAAIARDFPGTNVAAEALYLRAMSLLRREKWSAAEVSLAEAVASGKLTKERIPLAHYWRGIAAFRLGHIEEAIRALKLSLEGELGLDERREARLVIADAAFNEGRREEAVKIYSELVKEGAVDRMSAAKTLAVGRVLSGEEARICARRLIANESPEWRQAGFALLGDVETAAGNLLAASAADEKCLAESCTTEVVAHVAIRHGLYLVREENPAAAEKVLIRAVELTANDSEARASAYLGLARAALLRQDEVAAQGYQTVILTLFEGTKAAIEAKDLKR